MTANWECPELHPANNAPLMSGAELAELAADIKAHGLHKPIVLWSDNREEANGSEGPFQHFLLDGRNRLEALKLLGINDPRQARFGDLGIDTVVTLKAVKEISHLALAGGKLRSRWETDCDPYAFHRSMNVFRRHLTPEQRRWQIKQAILKEPTANELEGREGDWNHRQDGRARPRRHVRCSKFGRFRKMNTGQQSASPRS